MDELFIGIDLAWGEKNSSGFCVLEFKENKLQIVELKLLDSLEDILKAIQKYSARKISIGVDAPLIINNESGNREIEKEFNKDFAKYKISMLPVNRTILQKYSPNLRSEELYQKLTDLGFQRDTNANRVLFEVYPHSTIAVAFYEYKILPYKRKKGRSVVFIREQLGIYKEYISSALSLNGFLEEDILSLKGKALKEYEDKLDAITAAYTYYYCQNNASKFYKLNGVETFLTPI